MFRSVLAAQYNTIRTFASHNIQPPKTKIDLGNLADNAGAVSEVSPSIAIASYMAILAHATLCSVILIAFISVLV